MICLWTYYSDCYVNDFGFYSNISRCSSGFYFPLLSPLSTIFRINFGTSYFVNAIFISSYKYLSVYKLEKCRDNPIALANFEQNWKSADWKVSYFVRSTAQRSPKLRTTPQPVKLYFSARICGQFPANRFGGLSGISFTHTWARTECPWWGASAWKGGGGVYSWAEKAARRRKRARKWKRMPECEKLKRVEKGGLSWLFVIAVRKRTR